MTLYQLLTNINYFAGKDKRGKTFKISEFNDLLPTVQDVIYKLELDKLVAGDLQEIPMSRYSISPLRAFTELVSIQSVTGNADIPDNYRRWISISSNFREIKVVTQKEFNSMRTSPLRRPDVRPFCYIDKNHFVICPQSITSVELQYFRTPTTPYYDYCQDSATLNEIYMPAGSSIYLSDDNNPCLYSSTGVLLATGVEKDGLITYPILSQTVELEWYAIDHDLFVLGMLSMVGINLDKTELTQYAESKKNA